MKTLIKGIVLVLMFVGGWYALSLINWIDILKVEQTNAKLEKKLGDLLYDLFKRDSKEVLRPAIFDPMQDMKKKLCLANTLNEDDFQVIILNNDMVNAFALPGGRIVFFTGLLRDARKPEEIAGVLAHEMAHVSQKHVMKKLIKEIGLSALIAITSGSGSPEVIKEVAKLISSTAYDRRLEKEADLMAVEFMHQAKWNPEPLADFLERLDARGKDERSAYEDWISTHPSSSDRGQYIRKRIADDDLSNYEQVMDDQNWSAFKAAVDKL